MIKHYVRNIATDIPYIMLFYSEVFSSTNLRPNQDTLNETVFAESIVWWTGATATALMEKKNDCYYHILTMTAYSNERV